MQQSSNINIWQQAIKLKNTQISTSNQQKTIIILGNPSSGKSTILKILKTDSQQQIKPTILFQYSYIKKQSLNKQIIHCYELSNKTQQQIIPSLITKDSYNRTKIILCVDLIKGQQVIETVVEWMEIIKKQIEQAFRERLTLDEKIKEYYEDVNKILHDHEDSIQIKPLPIETIIIGCKYDQLELQDSQNRKWVNRALRYLAHINHTHLFYSSSHNNTMISQIRSVFNEVLFNINKRTTYFQRDHLKPIFISRGQDTLQSLNITATAKMSILDIIKKQLQAIYGNEEDGDNKKQGGQLDLTKYSQQKIDTFIQQQKKQMMKINAKLSAGKRDSIGKTGGRFMAG